MLKSIKNITFIYTKHILFFQHLETYHIFHYVCISGACTSGFFSISLKFTTNHPQLTSYPMANRAEMIIRTNRLVGYQSTGRRQY